MNMLDGGGKWIKNQTPSRKVSDAAWQQCCLGCLPPVLERRINLTLKVVTRATTIDHLEALNFKQMPILSHQVSILLCILHKNGYGMFFNLDQEQVKLLNLDPRRDIHLYQNQQTTLPNCIKGFKNSH